MSTKGNPTARNCRKEIEMSSRSMKPENWALGAVPILVPMPPTLAP
jgi:hypothetical protein